MQRFIPEKYKKMSSILFIIIMFIISLISVYFYKKNRIENYFNQNYSRSLKKAIKNGYFEKEIKPLPNATKEEKEKILKDDYLKKMQCADIDFLIYTADEFGKNKDIEIYHFINHPCPSSTMRILDTDEELKNISTEEKENFKNLIEKENEKILGQLKTEDSYKGRFKRRVDFKRILSYGNYKLFSRYTKDNCDCTDSFYKNTKLFSNTLFGKKSNALDTHEGTYYILHDKKSKIYHCFKLYASQNENPNIEFTKYEIFYKQIKDIKEIDYEFLFLFKEFNLNF